MRIAAFLFILGILQAYAVDSYSQKTKLSLAYADTELIKVLDNIEIESEFYFLYNEKLLDTDRKVSIDVNDQPINTILDNLFDGTDVHYTIIDRKIILAPDYLTTNKEPADLVQQLVISGKVTDSQTGELMPGVNVLVTGTTIGTITDVSGRYTIPVPDRNGTLRFSFIGYITQEIPLNGRSTIDVNLVSEITGLDEVVVIGYGTRQRRHVSGAINQVGTEIFADRPVVNTMQALQGSSPNLIIQQRNMNPNENTMNINIRGVTSLNNSDPLLVIDGMITTGLDALTSNLNPNDIESMTILKDASSAIYGSRAANGVILITTKQGAKNSTPKIRYNGGIGTNIPEILYRPVAGWKNAELRNHANEVTGVPLTFTAAQIADLKAHESEEKWLMDQVYKNALQQSHNLSVSGGGTNTTFMISAGHFNQRNNMVGDYGIQRYNFRSNLATEWGKFKINTSMAYSRTIDESPTTNTSGINTNVFRMPLAYYYKFKTDDGKYLTNDQVTDGNSLAILEKGGWANTDTDNILSNLNLEYTVMPGLKTKVAVGIDLTQAHRFRRYLQVPIYSETDLNNPRNYINPRRDVDDYNNKYYTLNSQFLFDFNRTFASVHNVNALLGVSNESYTREQNMVRWRYTDPDLGLNSGPDATQAGQASSNYTSNQGTTKRSIASGFGRASYNFDDRYYFEFMFRYDGSSKFSKDYRWGFFPSFSAAYRISEENFMNSYKNKFGDLKFRTTYGITGIQSINDYAFLNTYSPQPIRYGFNNIPYPGINISYGNEQVTWESLASFNVGFDASFFRNSLNVTFDWFKKRTYDILLVPVVPGVFGSSNIGTQNFGEMENVGWELSLDYKKTTGNFIQHVNFNISDAKNKVTNFGGREQIRQGEESWNIIREGEALGSYLGYKSIGLFQSDEEIANSALPPNAVVQPGDVKYKDTNKDGTIDENDRVVLGNAFPRYTFGLTYNLAWKGFDFNILVQGVGKRLQQIRGEMSEPFHHNFWIATMYEHQLDFWTPDNRDASIPRLATGGSSRLNNYQKIGTDIILYDMAYLRMKNISLGYTIPKQIFAKVGIAKTRISANVQNAFTFSKHPWVNPETTNFGNTMGGRSGVGGFYLRGDYPLIRYYGINIDLEF